MASELLTIALFDLLHLAVTILSPRMPILMSSPACSSGSTVKAEAMALAGLGLHP